MYHLLNKSLILIRNGNSENSDSEIINAICDKKCAHCKWKSSNSLSDFIEFKRLRAIYIKLSRTKYRNYISKVEFNLKLNIRSFWSFVNEPKKDSGVPSNVFLNHRTADNDVEITDLFSHHFSSAYNDTSLQDLPRSYINDACISNIELSVKSLRNIVRNLDDNVNPGPDDIPAYCIKRCWVALEKPICSIFENIFSSGFFSKVWKFSHIIPIFKGGNKHDVANYRPISIIRCLPKILDAYLANELSSTLFLRLAHQ